jgi:hypothetical protein
MSLVTANGVAVLSGTITMPIYGVWSADLVIDQPDGSGFEAGTEVTITAGDGLELAGTVVPDRTGSFVDSVHVYVDGGAAGMGLPATAKGYAQPNAYVRDVLDGIARDAGETLSDEIASSLLTTNLTAWATMQVSASQALVTLLTFVAPTANWRIRGDGKLWVGVEEWPATTAEFDILENNPSERTYDLGVDTFTVVPGIDLDGIGKVNRVEHQLSADKIRSHVWTEIPGEDRGLAGGVATIVRQEISGVDYFTLYDAKIVSQSSDGLTVDVRPGDARLPGMSKVPLRNGVAGTICKVAPGTFVRVGWDRGNPSMPYACLWQGGETVTEIDMDAALIRLGDSGAVFSVKGPALLTWLSAHTHPVVGATANASALATTGIQATKVKVT